MALYLGFYGSPPPPPPRFPSFSCQLILVVFRKAQLSRFFVSFYLTAPDPLGDSRELDKGVLVARVAKTKPHTHGLDASNTVLVPQGHTAALCVSSLGLDSLWLPSCFPLVRTLVKLILADPKSLSTLITTRRPYLEVQL